MLIDDAAQQFLAALPADGSPVANRIVHDKLGWSREDYDRVRDKLVEGGYVKKGRGHGGTIKRVVAVVTPHAARTSKARIRGANPEEQRPRNGSDSSVEPANAREEFALQLHEEAQARSSSGRRTYEQAVVEYVLEAVGEEQFDEPTACTYVDVDNFTGELRLRVDGYDLHEDDDDDRTIIDLFVVHAVSPLATDEEGRAIISIPTLEGVAMNTLFRTARRFVEESRRDLHRELTSDPEARDLARSIKDSKNLARVQINLITNAEVRQLDKNAETVDGIEIVRRVLDLNVLRRMLARGPIEVDFSEASASGIPCVPLPESNPSYRSFLAVVPGVFLCKLYEVNKQRLLEANVRSYLRAANHSVNHRIIETIRKHPEMFFAYNNGITATADEIVIESKPGGGTTLQRCRNLQIVNGGQTTASLFHAKLRKIPLDRVYVPMKINEVLDHSRSAEVVHHISIYANSQNKVNLSDLGANQPFHLALQKLAETVVPPVPAPGVAPNARWFYERMRGQYQNELTLRKSRGDKNAFRISAPEEQVITKTDVARYYMIWDQKPHIASLGSEKNYQKFMMQIPKDFLPSEAWFRELIAKALLTELCDALVVKSKIAGYKANIVAYTVALLSHVRGKQTNLDAIWRSQRVDDETTVWLKKAIEAVRSHITRPPREGMNVGEWCKKEDCWKSLLEEITTPSAEPTPVAPSEG